MSQPLFVKSEITIHANAAAVWDALVNPKQTKKYMFGCETVSNWNTGDSLEWKGVYEGQETVFVKGVIVDIHPEKYLAYTTIDPFSNIDDSAENYLTVTYTLISDGQQTHLNVTQGDYNKVAEGERRYAEAYNGGEGWNPILTHIKDLVENQGRVA